MGSMGMSRKLVIDSCGECPHLGHKGGFGPVSYVPICRKEQKELPYTLSLERKIVIANRVGGIPEWCPLPIDNADDCKLKTTLEGKNHE